MKELLLDIETYSGVDLAKCGVYRYAEDEDFRVLLFGYAVDGGAVRVVDVARGEAIPTEIVEALTDDNVIKWAFQAGFERVCLSRYLSDLGVRLDPFHDRHSLSRECARFLNPVSWRCVKVWGAYLGLPLSLSEVGEVLGLAERKLGEGRQLIRYFCVPNGLGRRNLPEGASDRWELFKRYNGRDVAVELAVQARLARYPVPDFVWEEYALDQEINDRGVRLDMGLVEAAIRLDEQSRAELMGRLRALTRLDNPNSVRQMKAWLAANGLATDSLDKRAVRELLRTARGALGEVLLLRQQLAKSSVRKYQAMRCVVSADGRARGMFQFYGANRTGRFAGRLIQLQNLVRSSLPELAAVRALVRSGDYAAVRLLYDSVPEVLSQLVRTALVPRAGCKFIVVDFAAIEARVLSWLAGELWRLAVFAANGDIYAETASRMFHSPVVKHGENGHLRSFGKLTELACGYGGSVGALKAFGALEAGMREDELQPLVDAWRRANPRIVRLWWELDRAAKEAIKGRTTVQTHGLRFSFEGGIMFIELPSGRRLAYVRPAIGTNRFGGESITYMGMNTAKKWERIESYGPKLAENVVQAISRDILCYALRTLRHSGIVAHVHDEVIIECEEQVSLAAICEQMSRTPPWAKGLVLAADGFEAAFYRKD